MSPTLTRRHFLHAVSRVGLATAVVLFTRAQPPPAPPFRIIPRAEWRAQPANYNASGESGWYDADTNPNGWLVYAPPLASRLHTVIVHHTAAYLSQNPRRVQQWHQERLGFADIGYHFLIGSWGHIYEGRPLNVRGAHTTGFNRGSIGIALMGHFKFWQPTSAQIRSLLHLLTSLKDSLTLTHLAGHRDCQPEATICPGHRLWIQLPALAAQACFQHGTGGFTP